MPKGIQGTATWSDPESDKPLLQIATVCCVHCGGAFPTPRFEQGEAARKSRVGRGYCSNCDGYVCSRGCAECVPVDLLLTNMEKGRPFDFKPMCVGVHIPEGS